MKKLIRILTLSALVATIWLPAVANTKLSLTATKAIAVQDEEAKAKLYNDFLAKYKTEPAAAYALAKEYLQKYPAESDQTKYLTKWINAYDAKEKEGRKTKVEELLRQQKYAEAFGAAKAILADEPADLRTLNNAVFAAMYAAGVNKNDSFNGEAAGYARKAIQLIQSGQPFDKKDETLGWLHSALGFFSLKTNPSEAVTNYIKAAGFEGSAKKDPQTYLFLADAYRGAEYVKVANDFKTRCATAEQQATPDCKALSDRLNEVVDRMVDAYARAVALATDAKYAGLKTEAMTSITPLYKFRHENSDAGLSEFIAGILAKPLPTGALGTGTASSTTPATSQSSTSAPNGTTPGATTTTTPAGANPGQKPAPASTTTTNNNAGKTPRRR
ncbi:MAG TPA: hypothetical protein VGC66_22685 [Pyrinomonadaceae bacterium]